MRIKYLLLLIFVFSVLSCQKIQKNELIRKAKRETKIGNYQEALSTYDELIQLDSTDEGPFIMKGHIYNTLGDLNKAKNAFRKAIKINPNNLWGYAGLSNTQKEEGNFDYALELINKSDELEPDNVTIINSKCQILQNLGRDKEAITNFQRLLEKNPKSIVGLDGISVSYLKIKKTKQAERFILKSLKLDSTNCKAL